jgi:hypothetical protein
VDDAAAADSISVQRRVDSTCKIPVPGRVAPRELGAGWNVEATIFAISYPVGSGEQAPLPHGVDQVGFEKLNVRLRRSMLSIESQLWKRSNKSFGMFRT